VLNGMGVCVCVCVCLFLFFCIDSRELKQEEDGLRQRRNRPTSK